MKYILKSNIIRLWLVAILVLGLSGCMSFQRESEQESSPETSTHQTSTSEPSMTGYTFEDDGLGFSIMVPSDWIYELDAYQVIFGGSENSDDYYTTVNIQNILIGPEGYSDLDAFFQDYQAQILGVDGLVHPYERLLFQRDGQSYEAIEFKAEYHFQGDGFEKWIVGIDRGDGVMHQYSYTAPKDLYHSNLNVAKQMLDSMTLIMMPVSSDPNQEIDILTDLSPLEILKQEFGIVVEDPHRILMVGEGVTLQGVYYELIDFYYMDGEPGEDGAYFDIWTATNLTDQTINIWHTAMTYVQHGPGNYSLDYVSWPAYYPPYPSIVDVQLLDPNQSVSFYTSPCRDRGPGHYVGYVEGKDPATDIYDTYYYLLIID